MSRPWCFCIPLLLGASLAAAPLAAQDAPASAAGTTGAVNASAIDALTRMGAALRAMKSFEVHADVTDEKVSEAGQKLTFGGDVTYRANLPGQLYAEVNSARKKRQFYFDGHQLTVYAPLLGYYASKPVSGSVGQLLDTAQNTYGIEFPLADLFDWGTDKAPFSVITSAIVLGPEMVGDVETDHLALRQPGVDWQVWLSRQTLLPQKLVITSLDDPTQPEYTAVLHWKPKASFGASTFHFTPGKNDHRIELHPADAGAAEEVNP